MTTHRHDRPCSQLPGLAYRAVCACFLGVHETCTVNGTEFRYITKPYPPARHPAQPLPMTTHHQGRPCCSCPPARGTGQKPMLWWKFDESLLFQKGERQGTWSEFQPPPQKTRYTPLWSSLVHSHRLPVRRRFSGPDYLSHCSTMKVLPGCQFPDTYGFLGMPPGRLLS